MSLECRVCRGQDLEPAGRVDGRIAGRTFELRALHGVPVLVRGRSLDRLRDDLLGGLL